MIASGSQLRAVPQLYALSLQARASGNQFDDDLNRLPLSSFFTLDASPRGALTDGLNCSQRPRTCWACATRSGARRPSRSARPARCVSDCACAPLAAEPTRPERPLFDTEVLPVV